MRLITPYKLISNDFPQDIITRFSDLISEPDWFLYDYRKSMFPTSTNDIYDSIMLRHSSEYTTSTIRNMPLYSKYKHLLNETILFISKFYIVNDYVAFLTRLGSGGEIAMHTDNGEFLENIHRLHIPIKTNLDCHYLMEKQKIHMKLGSVYEIDNQRQHGVLNKGNEARTHLIVNIYGSCLI